MQIGPMDVHAGRGSKCSRPDDAKRLPVDFELKKALRMEVDEGRDVLCPITLDDAWLARTEDVHWRDVRDKNILDFSKWKTKGFAAQFDKLLRGLKIYYTPPDKG